MFRVSYNFTLVQFEISFGVIMIHDCERIHNISIWLLFWKRYTIFKRSDKTINYTVYDSYCYFLVCLVCKNRWILIPHIFITCERNYHQIFERDEQQIFYTGYCVIRAFKHTQITKSLNLMPCFNLLCLNLLLHWLHL